MVLDREILKRVTRSALVVALALTMTLGIAGCDRGEEAIEDAQQHEAEEFEQNVEAGAGGASDAESAVDALNKQTEATEDAQNDY